MVSDLKEFVRRNVELDGVYFVEPGQGAGNEEHQVEVQARRVITNIRFRRKVAERVAELIGPDYE